MLLTFLSTYTVCKAIFYDIHLCGPPVFCVCDVTKTAVNFMCMKLQREAESDAHRTISPQ